MIILIYKSIFIVESRAWRLLSLAEFCLPELFAHFASWVAFGSKVGC